MVHKTCAVAGWRLHSSTATGGGVAVVGGGVTSDALISSGDLSIAAACVCGCHSWVIRRGKR